MQQTNSKEKKRIKNNASDLEKEENQNRPRTKIRKDEKKEKRKKRNTLKFVSKLLIHCNLFSPSYILMLFGLSKRYNENNFRKKAD